MVYETAGVFNSGHQYFCSVWESVKEGRLEELDGWSRTVGRLMLEHPQYQYFWETPSSEANLEKVAKREVTNPDVHLAIQTVILDQIENGDPPEATKAYKALLKAGIDMREARHTLGRAYAEVVWRNVHLLNDMQLSRMNLYIYELRRIIKNPKNVFKEHIRKTRKIS